MKTHLISLVLSLIALASFMLVVFRDNLMEPEGATTQTPQPSATSRSSPIVQTSDAATRILAWGEKYDWPALHFEWQVGASGFLQVHGQSEWRQFSSAASEGELRAALSRLQTYESLLRRPLQLPEIAPGETCPVKLVTTAQAEEVPMSDGQVHLVQSDPLTYRLAVSYGQDSDWGTAAAVAFIDGDYNGPLLLRGRQIDGSNELRFGPGVFPDRMLVLHGGPSDLPGAGPRGVTQNGIAVRISAPGCYAYQIDSLYGSQVIVFTAEQYTLANAQ
jgi:hypothetical protein